MKAHARGLAARGASVHQSNDTEAKMNPVILHIRPDRSVGEIQHEFSASYPFLSMEFYKPALSLGKNSVAGEKIASEKMLRQAMRVPVEGTVDISGETTTKSLESKLRDNYGLFVKLYRKSGNLWMKITLSDQWTLKQQNDHGKELSLQHKSDRADETGYNLESGIY
jgi:hypothetical protein